MKGIDFYFFFLQNVFSFDMEKMKDNFDKSFYNFLFVEIIERCYIKTSD